MYRQFWIWFSEENMISEMQFLPSLSMSDHLVMLINFKCFIQPEPDITFKKLNLFKGDYKSITSELSSIDWSPEINIYRGLSLLI